MCVREFMPETTMAFLTSAVFLNKKLFKLNFRFLEGRFC